MPTQRSIETAFHLIVGSIERPFPFKECTCGLFNIEGAFHNVSPDIIVVFTKSLGIYGGICRFVDKLLRNIVICFTIGATSVQRLVNRGTPQE